MKKIGGSGGFSDILNSFGNRGSSGGGSYGSGSLSDIIFGRGGNNRGYDDNRRQPTPQPQPQPSGGGSGSGGSRDSIFSGLSSYFGKYCLFNFEYILNAIFPIYI